MTRYVVEYCSDSSASPALASLNAVDAESLAQVVRKTQAVLAGTSIGHAVVYVPVRVLNASREVAITDVRGKKVTVDLPASDAEILGEAS